MTTIGGRYQLGDVIGDGGTATIYAATDDVLGVRCAVKLLKEHPGVDGRLLTRLLAEADTMSRLSHPNILRVFGAGDEQGGWIAMELAEGGSVADQVRDNGPLSPRRSIQLVLQLLSALQAAHDAGVVHRDVKPDNLLLQPDGTMKLADFGIALLDDATRMTRQGHAMGTLNYMAPEQRVDASKVGPSVDVFASGATLFNLLTGSTPVDLFLAPPGSTRFQGIPEGLVEIIRRATHADPSQRFDSPEAMSDALAPCLKLAADEAIRIEVGQDDGYVPTVLPETSRIATDTGVAGMEQMRDAMAEDWAASRDVTRRRLRPEVWMGIGLSVLVVIVAVGAKLSMDDWVDRQRAHEAIIEAPLSGVWKGTFGNHTATLELGGENASLSGKLEVALGAHWLHESVTGAVIGGELVMSESSGGLFKGKLGTKDRLDGEYEGRGRVEPFHFVRVE